MADESWDIIVVGAGIAGASAAWALADGARVLLVERESQPGYHATGRSAAYFAPAYGNATVRNLTAASAAFFRKPPAGFTQVPLIKPRHALFVGTQAQAAGLKAMRAENPTLAPLAAAEVSARVPIIKQDVIAEGLLDETGGDLDVDAILQGFLRGFRARGGEVRTRLDVASLAHRNGAWHMEAGGTGLSAPVIVNAAGAWADRVAVLAGLAPLELVPKRRTALLVDAPPGSDIDAWPLVIDIDEHWYFKPDAGQLLISPADETPSDPCDAQPDELDVAIAIDRVSQVAGIDVTRVNHRWAGLRTFAPDKTFVVGFDPRARGFFWLAGQGGYGVQSCPGMAVLAKHLLLDDSLPAPYAHLEQSLAAVGPERLIRT